MASKLSHQRLTKTKTPDKEEQTLDWELDRETFERPERTDARVGAIARGGRQSTSLALRPVGT